MSGGVRPNVIAVAHLGLLELSFVTALAANA